MAEQKVTVISHFEGKKTLQEVLRELIILKWKNK